jgi:hypothetical protein
MKPGNALVAMVLIILAAWFGKIMGEENTKENCVERIQPTRLFVTFVDDKDPPAVCIFDIATETLRGDNLRVVVKRTKCPPIH